MTIAEITSWLVAIEICSRGADGLQMGRSFYCKLEGGLVWHRLSGKWTDSWVLVTCVRTATHNHTQPHTMTHRGTSQLSAVVSSHRFI